MTQPLLGFAGLIFLVISVVCLGVLPGKVASLTTIITAITFGLPVLVLTTLWWNGWPFNSLSRAAGGWARFLFIAVATLLLTGIGQTITGGLDIGGIFGAEGAFGIFPYGFVLAASIFIPTLQLTFVTGKAPFQKLSPIAAGIAMFVTVWALGLAQYFFLLNWAEGPGRPPAPPVAGFGPIYALDWPAMLLGMLILQMVFFLLLKGFPFNGIRNAGVRFVVVNVFTIGGGLLLHWALRAVGMSDGQISALAGIITAAVVIIEILFDGWPFTGPDRAATRLGKITLAAVITAALYALLFAIGSIDYPNSPGTPPVELWMAGTGLNLIAAWAIVHAAVFGRWPFRVAGAAAPPGPVPAERSERQPVDG
jgi:hypothetical protein